MASTFVTSIGALALRMADDEDDLVQPDDDHLYADELGARRKGKG